MLTTRVALFIAAVTGCSGIVIGAFGAHALKDLLQSNKTSNLWNTAVLYHLIHASALLWAATRNPVYAETILCWVIGIVLFSGSLYLLAILKFPWIGIITPIGGVLLMAGWLIIAIRAYK